MTGKMEFESGRRDLVGVTKSFLFPSRINSLLLEFIRSVTSTRSRNTRICRVTCFPISLSPCEHFKAFLAGDFGVERGAFRVPLGVYFRNRVLGKAFGGVSLQSGGCASPRAHKAGISPDLRALCNVESTPKPQLRHCSRPDPVDSLLTTMRFILAR